MSEKRRQSSRWSAFGAALVYLEDGTYIDCIVKQLSARGADFVVDHRFQLPEYVTVLIPNETIRSAARVVWQHDDGFGVEFRDEKTLSILSEIQSRTNETRDRLNEYLFQFGDATTKIDEDIRECIGSLNVHMRLKRLREEFEENRESVALVFENSPEQAAPRIELETDAEEEVVADYNSSIDDLAQSIEAIILQFADEFGADSREITFLRKTHSEIQIRGKRRTKVSQRRGFGKRKPTYKQDVA